MIPHTLSAAIEANRGRPCVNPRCSYLRHRLEATCKRCHRKYLAYGSPTGRAVPNRAWKPYRSEVQRLLRIPLNGEHPALRAAVDFVQDWLERSKRAFEPDEQGFLYRFKGAAEALRLFKAGVPARLIVETVAAVSMWVDKAPVMTQLEEQHVYARAVFGLASRNVRVSHASGRKRTYHDRASRASLVATGKLFMEHLSGFIALVKQGVETMVEADAKRISDRESALRAPFRIT